VPGDYGASRSSSCPKQPVWYTKYMFGFLKRHSGTAKKAVNREVIERAYLTREKDIDSLRLYDRGEKQIHAPNLRDLVSRIRTAP
jgi:hypothetical protein